MKNKLNIYLPLLFALVLIAGVFIGYKLTPVTSGSSNIFNLNMKGYNKLSDVVNYIVQEYVDSISKTELTEEGIYGILNNLDPHSQYITAEEFHNVNDPLLGNFEGIGIQFRIVKDTIMVVHTIPGGPSEKAGLMAGDRIVIVDDSLIAGIGITNKVVMKFLKGKRGSQVNVNVHRRGIPEIIEFSIIRDVIPTFSIDIAYMPTETTGYIKVSKFSATTYEEFIKAIKTLKNQGMQNLILDLRGNAGGYLQAAIDMADEFLKKDQLIVYTAGKNQPRESFIATSRGQLEDIKINVLLDGGSASASEIVAGAIQDNDRGLIVGRRSFGKGLVQRQMDFFDGSALRLTVARYYTPTGRCIQKPYNKEKGFEDYYSESYHRYLNGEMESEDSTHFIDSLKYVTPNGKIVYGGGGIMPDIFVPVDNNENASYFYNLSKNGLIFRFAFEYADKNRKKLTTFRNINEFTKQFEISSVLFNEFVDFAEINGVIKDKSKINYSNNRIKTMLKAYICRNIFDDEGFYPIFLSIDNTFNKSLELFNE